MKSEILLLIISAIVSFTSCTLMPESDQWKIRSAATNYVESKLNAKEKMQWGYIERKHSCNVNGRECQSAEVKYNIILTSGRTIYKTLYLLMSEHCDSVYNISEQPLSLPTTNITSDRVDDLEKLNDLINKRTNLR